MSLRYCDQIGALSVHITRVHNATMHFPLHCAIIRTELKAVINSSSGYSLVCIPQKSSPSKKFNFHLSNCFRRPELVVLPGYASGILPHDASHPHEFGTCIPGARQSKLEKQTKVE